MCVCVCVITAACSLYSAISLLVCDVRSAPMPVLISHCASELERRRTDPHFKPSEVQVTVHSVRLQAIH